MIGQEPVEKLESWQLRRWLRLLRFIGHAKGAADQSQWTRGINLEPCDKEMEQVITRSPTLIKSLLLTKHAAYFALNDQFRRAHPDSTTSSFSELDQILRQSQDEPQTVQGKDYTRRVDVRLQEQDQPIESQNTN